MTSGTGILSWSRVRLPRSLSRIAKMLYVGSGAFLGLLLLVFDTARMGGGMAVGLALIELPWLVAMLLFVVSYVVGFSNSSSPADVEVQGRDLLVRTREGRTRRVEARDVASALVVDRTSKLGAHRSLEVELTSGDRLTATFADPAVAVGIVDALGFGPSGKRARVSLATPSRRLLHVLVGAGVFFVVYTVAGVLSAFTVSLLSGAQLGAVFVMEVLRPLLAIAIYELVVGMIRPPVVTVGADGVAVERGGRRRFFSRRAGLTLANGARGLEIRSEAGPSASLGGTSIDRARTEAVAALITARRATSAVAPETLAAFDRGESDVAGWRARLAEVMEQASYRSRGISVDEAAAVLGSGEASAEQKVGAALALRVAGEAPERIRVVAEAQVDERVRAALEAVAAEDVVGVSNALSRRARR